jgi:nucleosome binding factor SPN SPT16 subunit
MPPLLISQANLDTLWGGATAIVVATGASSEDLRYLKSLALHLWLLGYELPGV